MTLHTITAMDVRAGDKFYHGEDGYTIQWVESVGDFLVNIGTITDDGKLVILKRDREEHMLITRKDTQ